MPDSKSASPHDPVLRALRPWIEKQRRAAWKPIVEGSPDPPAGLSQFGGLPHLPPGESPPVCGGCSKPIDLFLQLDGRDVPDNSPWAQQGLLQFFYCQDCEQEEDGWGPFSKAHVIRVVSADGVVPSGERPTRYLRRPILGWERLDDLPSAEEQERRGLHLTYDFEKGPVAIRCPELDLALDDIDLEATDDDGIEIAEAICDAALGDKLGGWPHWIQSAEYPTCEQCSTTMHYVFQIDSNDNIDYMFGDMGCGHITRCPHHPDVFAFVWACS